MRSVFSQRSAGLACLALLAAPLLFSGCRFAARGYVNTSSASLANNVQPYRPGLATSGLNLRIALARSRQRALQAQLSRARASAVAMRDQAAQMAQASAERTRQAIQDEVNKAAKGGEENTGSNSPEKDPRYPS